MLFLILGGFSFPRPLPKENGVYAVAYVWCRIIFELRITWQSYRNSSLNVFDYGVVSLRSIFLDFIHRPYVSQPQRFPRYQVNLLWWVRSIELVSIGGLHRWISPKK
jgi:hypothetical protein